MLQKSKSLAQAFGKEVIESYIKLKTSEIRDFKNKSTFNKKKPVTKWEKDNTLDC
jgi:glutamine synthetase